MWVGDQQIASLNLTSVAPQTVPLLNQEPGGHLSRMRMHALSAECWSKLYVRHPKCRTPTADPV